jgi:hypothetical protein
MPPRLPIKASEKTGSPPPRPLPLPLPLPPLLGASSIGGPPLSCPPSPP